MPINKEKIFAIFPFLLVFYEITTYLANDMYLPALPSIAADLNTTTHYAQMTLTTWFFGTVSMQLLLGPLSDRYGRRIIVLGGGIIFLLATLVCALTSQIDVLLIARFFQGCAVCSVTTAGYSSIHEMYKSKEAIHIIAIMDSINVLAPAFGPLIGAVILTLLSWRWIFWFLLIWSFAALSMLWLWMPESNPAEKRHALDWKLLLNNYFSIFRNIKFMANTLVFCLLFLAIMAWLVAGPFLVISTYKFNTFYFGLFQAMIFGSLVLGAQMVKYIIAKLGANKLINLGLGISLVGSIIAFILSLFFTHYLLGLVIALMIFAFGSSLLFSPSQRAAVDASTEPMGARLTVFFTLMNLFGVLGSLLVSLTYNGTLFWFGCLLIIVSVAAVLIRWLEIKYC